MSDDTVLCRGTSPFAVQTMLSLCERCTHTASCQQSAADAPFVAVGVWGGLELPKDKALLPAPRTQAAFPKRVAHRPNWWEISARSGDADQR